MGANPTNLMYLQKVMGRAVRLRLRLRVDHAPNNVINPEICCTPLRTNKRNQNHQYGKRKNNRKDDPVAGCGVAMCGHHHREDFFGFVGFDQLTDVCG